MYIYVYITYTVTLHVHSYIILNSTLYYIILYSVHSLPQRAANSYFSALLALHYAATDVRARKLCNTCFLASQSVVRAWKFYSTYFLVTQSVVRAWNLNDSFLLLSQSMVRAWYLNDTCLLLSQGVARAWTWKNAYLLLSPILLVPFGSDILDCSCVWRTKDAFFLLSLSMNFTDSGLTF